MTRFRLVLDHLDLNNTCWVAPPRKNQALTLKDEAMSEPLGCQKRLLPGDDLTLAHPGDNRHVVRLTSSETLNAVADELVDCAKRIANSICAASYDNYST